MADKSALSATPSTASSVTPAPTKTPDPKEMATKPQESKPTKPPKEQKPAKPPKETEPPKPPKTPKPPKPPKPPMEPKKPPGKVMGSLLRPVPYSRGGCCGDTLPFSLSCLLIALSGLIPSLANLAVVLAYTVTYTDEIEDPAGHCIYAWWETDTVFLYVFKLPTLLQILHVALMALYACSCSLLLLGTVTRSVTFLRINSLLGFGLLFPTAAVGILEVSQVSSSDWIHWNFVFLLFFCLLFLYATMIVNGYDKRLQNPPKPEEDEDFA